MLRMVDYTLQFFLKYKLSPFLLLFLPLSFSFAFLLPLPCSGGIKDTNVYVDSIFERTCATRKMKALIEKQVIELGFQNTRKKEKRLTQLCRTLSDLRKDCEDRTFWRITVEEHQSNVQTVRRMLRGCGINVNDGVVGFPHNLRMLSLNLKY